MRCPRCFLKLDRCLCAELPRVDVSTRVVLVRHALERFKTSNTGRLAAMTLRGAELFDVGVKGTDDALPGFGEGAWILWPDGPVLEVAPPVETLVVLDGTWPQTRRMMQRLPGLRGLPRLALPAGADRVRLRRPRAEGEMSTLEAIAAALAWLEGEETASPLFDLYDRFVVASIPDSDRKRPQAP